MNKKTPIRKTKAKKNPPKVRVSRLKSLWGRIEDDEKEEKLRIFCQLNPTLKEVAAFFGVTISTIDTWINNRYSCNFEALKSYHLTDVKLRLTGKAIKMAEAGEKTMLKFALQNLCDWTEKSKVDASMLMALMDEVKGMSDEEVENELKGLVE